MSTLSDVVWGCVLGGAYGDAFASAAEGRVVCRETYEPSWRLTDDTQLTLATCEAFVKAGGVVPEVLASTFLAWYRARRLTGLGSTTLGALRSLHVGAHWALAGVGGERAAGCGAAMRVAPLSFVLDMGCGEDVRRLRDVCRVTHHHEEAYAGAKAMLLGLQYLRRVPEPAGWELLAYVVGELHDSRTRDGLVRVMEEAPAAYGEAAGLVGTSGYAPEAVVMALVGARRGRTVCLEEVLWDVVEHGGDTDSIGAMVGQLVGVASGREVVSRDVLEKVQGLKMVEAGVEAFVGALLG